MRLSNWSIEVDISCPIVVPVYVTSSVSFRGKQDEEIPKDTYMNLATENDFSPG